MAVEYLERMGARMRKRREELQLSRADVARLMPGKTNENAIYRWEIGQHRAQPDSLEALAKVLKVDVSYFMAAAGDDTSATTPSPFADKSAPEWAHELGRKLDLVLSLLGEQALEEGRQVLEEIDPAEAAALVALAAARAGRGPRRRGV